MRIAIVDDEKEMLDMVSECVERTLAELRKDAQISCYSSADLFLEKWFDETENEENATGDFCILDIEMPGMQGIELGKRMKEIREELPIIFLTSYDKFALQSYEVEAYQYILKSQMEERLPAVIAKLIEKMQREEGAYRVIEHSSKVERLLYRDVLYVRKEGKYVVYVTEQNEIRERTSLDSVRKELEQEGFVMIERGFLANIRHIARIESNELHLDNQEKLYIGRRMTADVKRAVSRYWKLHG